MKALPDEEGIETRRVAQWSSPSSMKALPDEEGIETISNCFTDSANRMKALPDEEGIETSCESARYASSGYEGTP